MKKFELDYAELVGEILKDGVNKITRNGITRSLFGKSLVIDDIQEFFPIIQGRQMHIKGILGEFAAMVRQPKHIDDFEKWGCNYWKLWADDTVTLILIMVMRGLLTVKLIGLKSVLKIIIMTVA